MNLIYKLFTYHNYLHFPYFTSHYYFFIFLKGHISLLFAKLDRKIILSISPLQYLHIYINIITFYIRNTLNQLIHLLYT